MRLIAGLGNPGPTYQHTRHNVGFAVLDRLASRLDVAFNREKFNGQVAEAVVDGRKVVLLKPLTFMNLSGNSLAQAARYHAEAPGEILVVYDEIDLPLGKVRLRKSGSAGTHNGMKSVIERLGTDEVPRLRVGVGEEARRGERVGHVLGRFRPDERAVIDEAMGLAVDACLCCVRDGLDAAMNRFN